MMTAEEYTAWKTKVAMLRRCRAAPPEKFPTALDLLEQIEDAMDDLIPVPPVTLPSYYV